MNVAKPQSTTERHTDRELTSRLKAVLEEYPEVQGAYLFGSYARGTHGAASDVDVAVVFDPDTSAWTELELQEMLSSRLGMLVQVIDLAAAGPDIVESVQRDGVTLVDRVKSDVERPKMLAEGLHGADPRAGEAIWLLESAADKVQRIDRALPLLADVNPEAVLEGDIAAIRDFLGVFMLLIEPLETLVRRLSRYAHLVLEYEAPETTLRAQTELTAQVLNISDDELEKIGEMARLRGRLAHAYWDLDKEELDLLAPERLRPTLEHLVDRASRFISNRTSTLETLAASCALGCAIWAGLNDNR